ncbi:AOX2 [Candida oxycetoniae]|uniref:Alternative oxidase n=1 Tax=Candida oxycetoniae TaxID=497107 RepID=A0AAI9STU2_9ASCO|nr:AOX2 [Candida oxycetoniae]KAI3402930.2 AOX2 [Candida oxycetoniae]
MLRITTYRQLPRITCSIRLVEAVRFTSTTHVPPIREVSTKQKDERGHANLGLPKDQQNSQKPGFKIGNMSFLDIGTRVYNNQGIAEQDDNKFTTKPAYVHADFTETGLQNVDLAHHVPKTLGDKVSLNLTLFCRHCFDLVTGYKWPKTNDPNEFKGTRWEMTESKWLTRVIFLESVAGVPGATASFLRHLYSLRMLKRDRAWCETLIDEAYNERVHLLTFLKIGKPSWFTRSIIYIGQGIFTNVFFFMYLLKPTYCHRFVGYLEEEAVKTYTHLLHDMDQPGNLPLFQNMKVPQIAVDYWPNLTQESSFRDLILQIRADESKHREVNHTFANLDQHKDRNPFALHLPDENKPQPNSGLDVVKPAGWERKDLTL